MNNITFAPRKEAPCMIDVRVNNLFIGTIFENQVEKAKRILEIDPWGRNFYNKLYK